ncbi:hypothetical protein ERO13_A13G133401v2 [Gossypium hirsutum]|nr:hypothetical protein ERO13_A13G133401v2 [Gossypium hirsutum]
MTFSRKEAKNSEHMFFPSSSPSPSPIFDTLIFCLLSTNNDSQH